MLKALTHSIGSLIRSGFLAAILCLGATAQSAIADPAPQAPDEGITLAAFACDVTPPMGHPLSGGWIKPLEGVDDPEFIKGIVLRDGSGTYVLAAVDWCLLMNTTYDVFREKLAEAAGTKPSNVALQCVHQHNALISDIRAQQLLDQTGKTVQHLDLSWYDRVTSKAAQAVRDAMGKAQRVTHYSTSMAKVDRVASNRRVKGPDGKIQVRWSATKDAAVRDAPEGLVDPWLRTITFYDHNHPVARLHYYATHPQSYYGDGRATWDVPGIARERLQRETGVFQVYFTGCAGDITMGKYNDGAHELRQELAERLYDAMKRSCATPSQMKRIGPLNWKTLDVQFPLLKDDRLDDAIQRKIVEDTALPDESRLKAAISLAYIERAKSGRPIELSSFALGNVRILHLPGEPFVEFQLAAQRARPDAFIAVAGYGDGGTGYICTASAYPEGGYEPSDSNVAPEGEAILKDAIKKLLSD